MSEAGPSVVRRLPASVDRDDPIDDTRRAVAAAVREAVGYFVADPALEVPANQ
jgi:hypothetical protein